jgi:hypothetical protein
VDYPGIPSRLAVADAFRTGAFIRVAGSKESGSRVTLSGNWRDRTWRATSADN